MTALLLTAHNVLHYLRDNQTMRREGGGGWIYAFYGHTPTRRTRRQNSSSSLWPCTATESPRTHTRAVTSLLLRLRTEVLRLPKRTELIQVLTMFRNRP